MEVLKSLDDLTVILLDGGLRGEMGLPGTDGVDGIVQSVNGISQANIILTKTDISLGNVDNTSDVSKPISTLTQAALDALSDDAIALAVAL